jgi:hypothetical protein
MKSFFPIYLLILFTFLLFQGCSEDSPSEPENNVTVLTSGSVGTEGGILKTDDFEISIPAGAFQSSNEIKILESSEDNLFGANALSDFYTLDGLPLDFNEPLKIKIKYNGTLTDSYYIAVGEKNFAFSLNEETTSYHLISAVDSADFLIITLPPANNSSLEKSVENSSINTDKLSFNLGAIAGYVSYLSPQGHFRINFPSSVLTQAYDLADYLETAYNKFNDIGFSYSKRTKWPVDVTVKRLNSNVSTVYGYSVNSMWGNNYGYMQFNFDQMDDAENLKVTAGHEFFHLIQSLYDPRYGYTKSKSPGPQYWLDEAASVWSESFFSSTSNYLSPIFSDNVFDVFKGAKTGNDQDQSAEYGYGMSSFIKYLTKNHGDDKLVDVYNNIYSGKSPFQSLSEILSINVGYSWHSYLRSLLTFDLYSGDTFRSGLLISYATSEHQKFIIKSVSDSLATYKSDLPDLSATIFSVDNQFSSMSDNSILEFTCKDWNFQLYKVNSTSCALIKSGKGVLTVDNFKKLTEDGYKVIAVLYNDDYDSPFENSKEYEMEIRVKMPPKNIIAVKFYFGFTGTYKTEQSTTSYYDSFWNDGYVANTTSQINGNTVSVLETYIDTYHNIEVTTEIIFDDIENPKSVVSIKCKETDNYNASQSIKIRTAEAKNIPFSFEFDNGTKQFLNEGDISQHLTKLTHLTTDHNGATTKELLSYESQGRIEVMVYYEQ